jgi:hypothetical protein
MHRWQEKKLFVITAKTLAGIRSLANSAFELQTCKFAKSELIWFCFPLNATGGAEPVTRSIQ